MIEPYMVIGLQTTTYQIKKRSDIKRNLDHISDMMNVAIRVCGGELPVKIIAIPEGAITGWQSDYIDYITFARECAINIPGEETGFLSEKAKEKKTYILAQALAKISKFPDRYFNTNFVIDPQGKVILKQYKNAVFIPEHSTTPHDVYDQWIELYGDTLDAFFPVVKTKIGNIAVMNCFEGSFPESYRAFAMNGAEIIFRPSYLEPYVSQEWFEIQNRGAALNNSCYLISPNNGPVYDIDGKIIYCSGGRSMIVDYRGQIISQSHTTSETYIAAPINIEQLRYHRVRGRAYFLSQLRTEIYKKLYEKTIWPKNSPSANIAEKVKMHREVINDLIKRGVCTPPDGWENRSSK